MINLTNNSQFPRELTEREKYFLFSVLPEFKPGYKNYRNKIEQLFVTGFGRFGGTNMVLGELNSKPDFSLSSASIFAVGSILFKEGEIYVIIHEEIDNEIEFDISFSKSDIIPETLTEIKKWNYSEWVPGQKAPNDNSEVREVLIKTGEFILAAAPLHKKIWLHDFKDGVNHIIPLSNYYNYIMTVKNIRDPLIALKPNLLFENLYQYRDEEMLSAFILYNKYFRKVKFDYSSGEKIKEKRKKSIINFLKKD